MAAFPVLPTPNWNGVDPLPNTLVPVLAEGCCTAGAEVDEPKPKVGCVALLLPNNEPEGWPLPNVLLGCGAEPNDGDPNTGPLLCEDGTTADPNAGVEVFPNVLLGCVLGVPNIPPPNVPLV